MGLSVPLNLGGRSLLEEEEWSDMMRERKIYVWFRWIEGKKIEVRG